MKENTQIFVRVTLYRVKSQLLQILTLKTKIIFKNGKVVLETLRIKVGYKNVTGSVLKRQN